MGNAKKEGRYRGGGGERASDERKRARGVGKERVREVQREVQREALTAAPKAASKVKCNARARCGV